MDSIRRDISDDDNALIRALFVSKHNAVVAVRHDLQPLIFILFMFYFVYANNNMLNNRLNIKVLTSVGYYMHKHHSDFFDASNWKEILVNCFDTESSAPNTSSRFSLNASSIPASQVNDNNSIHFLVFSSFLFYKQSGIMSCPEPSNKGFEKFPKERHSLGYHTGTIVFATCLKGWHSR